MGGAWEAMALYRILKWQPILATRKRVEKHARVAQKEKEQGHNPLLFFAY